MDRWVSIYWVAPIVAWLAAQLVKVIIAMVGGDRSGWKTTIVSSGGMPSSHSSITIALLVVVAVRDGLNSAAFGVAFVLTSIVIYDALNVRRAVGEQGEVLKDLANGREFYRAMGHKPTEVIVGVLTGVAVAVCLLQIL